MNTHTRKNQSILKNYCHGKKNAKFQCTKNAFGIYASLRLQNFKKIIFCPGYALKSKNQKFEVAAMMN